MKKLVIFLILFIFSISAFAQDESVLAENFSLIKDPSSNDRGFLSLKNLFPANYLFFTQNKKHPRKHQTFQTFSSLQFSDRAPLSRIATVENKKQKWGDIYNFMYGKQQNINSEKKSESLAEFYLKRTAERYKKRRKIGGTIALVVGGGLIAWGASMTSEEPEGWFDISSLFGTLYIITGAACVGGGIYYLAVPSRAEREHDDVLSISDSAQRERASHEALSLLAARGRRNRILRGILSAVYSVGSLVGMAEGSLEYPARTYEYAYAAGGAALAVYSFVVKSPAETAFQDYLRERKREQRKELEFRLGVMPYGGVKVGFVYSF
jgi:hypothetical protein